MIAAYFAAGLKLPANMEVRVPARYGRTLVVAGRCCDDGRAFEILAGGFGGKHTVREGSNAGLGKRRGL